MWEDPHRPDCGLELEPIVELLGALEFRWRRVDRVPNFVKKALVEK